MNKMCIRDLAELLGGRLQLGAMPPLGGDLEPIGRIVVDCRQIQAGDVFWATMRDGQAADHAEEAFARGALGVVAGRRVEPWAGKFSLEVPDACSALDSLLNAARNRFSGRLVVVTGDSGKTTAAHWIHAALRQHASGSLLPSTPLTPWPLTLLDLNVDRHYGVLEAPLEAARIPCPAASLSTPDATTPNASTPHASTLRKLDFCRPDVIVVTSSDRNRADEQCAELQAWLDAIGDGGVMIVNGDDAVLSRFAAAAKLTLADANRIVTVGRGSHCDVTAVRVKFSDGCLSFDVEDRTVRIPAWGRHHLPAILAAYCVARRMDVSPDDAWQSLSDCRTPTGACQVVRTDRLTLVADSPRLRSTSVRAALDLLRELEVPGRRIVVCGSFATNQRGESLDRWAGEIGAEIVTRCGADILVTVGSECERLLQAARRAGMGESHLIACLTPQDATEKLRALLAEGDAVLISGRDQEELAELFAALTPLALTSAA